MPSLQWQFALIGGSLMTKSSSRVVDRKRSTRVGSADRWAIGIVGGLAVVAVIVVVALFSPHSTNLNLVDGVVTYANLPRDHSNAPQTYPQIPPVGGVHN